MVAGLQTEIRAYDHMRNHLESDFFGKWVVVRDEELVGTYETFEDAAEVAIQRFGRGPYLIRQVGAPPVTLPGSVLYGPLNAHDDSAYDYLESVFDCKADLMTEKGFARRYGISA